MFAIHLCARNDVNGNPRRAYLVCNEGGIVACVDEGYRGTGALKGFRNVSIVEEIHVSAKELKRYCNKYGVEFFGQEEKG